MSALDQSDVAGARTLLRVLNGELDPLAFAQQLEHRSANGAAMEEVLEPILVTNEAEPLVNEETCNRPSRHTYYPPATDGPSPVVRSPDSAHPPSAHAYGVLRRTAGSKFAASLWTRLPESQASSRDPAGSPVSRLRLGRLRLGGGRGVGGPEMAPASGADPVLIGRPGGPGGRVLHLHLLPATLAADLQQRLAHGRILARRPLPTAARTGTIRSR